MFDILKEGVVSAAGMISIVIVTGVSVLSTLFAYRIFKKNKIKIPIIDVEVELNKAWIFILILTSAHFFTSIYLSLSVEAVHNDKSLTINQKNEIWETITKTNGGGLIFRTMQKRIKTTSLKIPIVGTIDFYKINTTDFAGVLSTLLCVLILLAVPKFEVANRKEYLQHLGIAILLMLVNWFIGSWWSIQLSTLSS